MIDFWIAASGLLLAALALLLLPLWWRCTTEPLAEKDRMAINIALYKERLAELAAPQTSAQLTMERLAEAQVEASRELLEDTALAEPAQLRALGRAVPLAMALLVPLVALGLYLHWGASEQLALARDFAKPPASMAEMTMRLERAVQVQPGSAEGWYLLGRTYMAQARPAEAAKAFTETAKLGWRQPELLGQWAQARYFAENRQWSDALQTLADEALQGNPQEPTTLGLLGIAAFEQGRYQAAAEYWQRLADTLPEQDASRTAILNGVQQAHARLTETAGVATQSTPTPVTLSIRLSLSEAVQAKTQLSDSVFLFAQAPVGSPLPVAAKRLTVADLPATLTLSDDDAMLATHKLSDFAQVRLSARISRNGDATQGEWKGESGLINVNTAGVSLTIDQPDKR